MSAANYVTDVNTVKLNKYVVARVISISGLE